MKQREGNVVIIRYEDARVLLDREALATITGRSKHTIRAKLQPAMRDDKGRPLYVLDDAEERLEAIPRRSSRRAA